MKPGRGDRLSDRLVRTLSDAVLRELRDPRVGFVTLTGAKVTPDLQDATVFVSTPEGPERLAEAIEALNHAAPFLRKFVATHSRLRRAPRLRFAEDTAILRGSRVEELLERIRDDRQDDEPDA